MYCIRLRLLNKSHHIKNITPLRQYTTLDTKIKMWKERKLLNYCQDFFSSLVLRYSRNFSLAITKITHQMFGEYTRFVTEHFFNNEFIFCHQYLSILLWQMKESFPLLLYATKLNNCRVFIRSQDMIFKIQRIQEGEQTLKNKSFGTRHSLQPSCDKMKTNNI